MSFIPNFPHDGVVTVNRVILKPEYTVDDLQERVALLCENVKTYHSETGFVGGFVVMNTGLITNLEPGSCVEVPCLVDNMGVHPCHVGDMPPQCAALNRNRSAGDGLAVKGTLEGDRKAIEQAVALDPLTAALCTLDQIHDMVGEAFKALDEWLPATFK